MSVPALTSRSHGLHSCRAMMIAVCSVSALIYGPVASRAQNAAAPAEAVSPSWSAGVTAPVQSNTTIVPRGDTGDAPADAPVAQVKLVALLTADGQKIDRDVVWRVFRETAEQAGKSKLVTTFRTASPTLRAPAGDYLVNAAFGRANVTRKLSLKAEAPADATERFVLNAGGMRVSARVAETAAPLTAISYSIFSDRDQTGDRRLIIAGVKPGLVVRLNAGIYHIVSTVGDTNAVVESDITVEAGKLTEAAVTHTAAKATFKLVSRPGGEALAGTQWTIKTDQGVTVKESTGALPTHVLAPGNYTAIARAQGKTLERPFTVSDGQATQVEVIAQ